MIGPHGHVRVFGYPKPCDMRKSFNGLHGLVVEVLRQDPQSGDFFVFINRRRDRVKVLLWEGDGLAIWYKHLQGGTFALPEAQGDAVKLTAAQLSLLLGGIDLRQTRQRRRYRQPA